MNRRNICFENGNTSESLFKSLIEKKGKICVKSNSLDDMQNKIDYYIGESKLPVQIKSIPNSDINTRCIEFFDVRGNYGWMYSKAEVIVFETNYGFILIKIEQLWELLKNKLNFYLNNNVNFKYDDSKSLKHNIENHYNLMKNSNNLKKDYYKRVKPYNLYTREDWEGKKRLDFCTKVPIEDLESIVVSVIKK